ncbi:MAG: Y4yA family PLP-dependent enzyme [Actinomycetota bacterium]|nr:Y4yA family PLP-dependent enzyme [Actinomycetota bacterium]
MPLRGRLEPWQEDLAGDPDRLAGWISEHGSPMNLIETGAMARNAGKLESAAQAGGVPFRIFFARKANKALAFVDEAKRLGLGVDVASERELRQVLDRGVDPVDVIVTAAVKPRAMLELCVRSGVTVAIDNLDEVQLLRELPREAERETPIAMRLSPTPGAGRPPSRFGMSAPEIRDALGPPANGLTLQGIHFHLDGYDLGERVAAIAESLELIDSLRERGHEPAFLDIGGGIPMSYLASEAEWAAFWTAQGEAVEGGEPEITFDGHQLGTVYPYHQTPVRGEWLERILDAALHTGTVADAIRLRGLELRCEPGRSLLDGCGMTVARVEFRKQRLDGEWLIGLAMNRTQMRSTSDDFLVDPLLLRSSEAGEPTPAIEAYLVGAYCIERELLSWRRFRFPEGVGVGDLVAFPNTAGYLMHILESASHQIPLARNLVLDGESASLDPIDVLNHA